MAKSTYQLINLVSPSVCLLVILFSLGVHYYDGVNEFAVSLFSYTFYYQGLLFGGESVYVDTSNGRLEGFTSRSRENRKFYEFLGIPYALPPIGALRFEPPQPPSSWKGVKKATGYGYPCLQYDIFLQTALGSEDCLTLNVYTPKISKGEEVEKLPVLVFVHGGLFMFGKSLDFRGDHFMDEDVVVVTVNYRLSALGFLNTGDGVVMGNMGLKDQVMALKWVQTNIRYFGGDQSKVTLWGQSAGGVSVFLHQYSQMSKGLFHRAISMSGPSLVHWGLVRNPQKQAKNFARRLNCPTSPTQKMVKCLKNVNYWNIVSLYRTTQDMLHARNENFAPSIESENENSTEAFLNENPRTILDKGIVVTKVPTILGVNSDEGLVYSGYILRNETLKSELNKNWKIHGPNLIGYDHLNETLRNHVSKELWEYYIGNNETISFKKFNQVTSMFSDLSFNKAFGDVAIAHSKLAPLYLYQYSHKGCFGIAQHYMRLSLKAPLVVDGIFMNILYDVKNFISGHDDNHYGVCHGDELAIFFKLHPLLASTNKNSKEYEFSRNIVRTWSHFAKNGHPSSFYGEKWISQESSQDALKMLILSGNENIKVEMSPIPFQKRLNFLNQLQKSYCISQHDKCEQFYI